uniref:DUF1639 family protein n=1 Tax=Oryza brachyantha TaxID=4533 RepID=J3L316_ORYBR
PAPQPQPRSPEPELPAAPLPTPPPPPQDASPAAAARPWNLRERKRRSSARGSTGASPTTSWAARRAEAARGGGERAPFAVALSSEEIEEDIYALTGGRPRRRPRKRPRVVQRQLDSLFPGLWLTEITADAYKVPDD